MKRSVDLTQQQLRSVFEARLKLCLTNEEFMRLLSMGNGLFWDRQKGAIRPYDLATLQSGKQLLERLDTALP